VQDVEFHVHETETSPSGVPGFETVHSAPASVVTYIISWPLSCPTAMQAVDEEHETLERVPLSLSASVHDDKPLET
jgi:hypothetical protein